MAPPPILDDPNQAARRAKTRIGVAVLLLAVALGGLALLNQQKSETPSETGITPEQKQESVASEQPTSPPPPAQISSDQVEPPPPVPAEPPPPPTVSATPPAPPPAAEKVPASPPSVTSRASAPLMEKPAEKETPKEAAKPIGQKPAPAAAAPATSPTKTEPAPKSYEVQVGVFTDMENAKQLQAKLAEHGIPSHTETKLQVGPFATRAEAEAAREKLKALGIGAVVVPGK